MASKTLEIAGLGNSAAPLDYVVPAAQSFELLAVRATFDGASAVSPWYPAVELYSDSGVLMARAITPVSVVAGSAADVTFAPFLGSTQASAGGGTLDQRIFATNVRAWYKLNESGGTTAFDSTANRFDMPTASGQGTPTWGNAAGPPGTQTAHFQGTTPPFDQMARPLFPSLGTSWTAGVWVNRDDLLASTLLSQGFPFTSGQGGWSLRINAFNAGFANHFSLWIGNSTTTPTIFQSDGTLTSSTWYSLAATMTAGAIRMYVNGAPQSASGTPAYTPTSSLQLSDSAGTSLNGLMSYAMVWDTALTDAEIASVFGP